MDSLIYFDNYVLRQDMRIRLPKAILSNLNIEKGITRFNFFGPVKRCIVLKAEEITENE